MSIMSKLIDDLTWFRNELRKGGKTSEYYESQVDIVSSAIDTIKELSEKVRGNNDWIPLDDERKPKNDTYVLVSFENYTLADIARYEEEAEGGTFYLGDEDESYKEFGLFVNAWMPLPEPYQPEETGMTQAEREEFFEEE